MEALERTLILMRHGHSPQNGSEIDHSRKLDNSGLIQARKAGEFVRNHLSGKIKILVSSSDRTLETAKAAFPEAKGVMETKDELYLAPVNLVIECIAGYDPGINTLIIVGHNPFITQAVNHVSDTRVDNMPAGAAAVIKYGWKNWKDILITRGKLAGIWLPERFY